MEPQSPHRLGNGLAGHAVIDAVKVIRREERFLCKSMQINIAVEMIDQVIHHALDALGVGLTGKGFHLCVTIGVGLQ